MVKSADNTARGFLVKITALIGGLDLKLEKQCQDIECTWYAQKEVKMHNM